LFVQKLVLSYGSKLVIQFVQIVTGIIVSRIVGPTVLGYLAYGLSFVTMFAVVNDLGMGTAHIKMISQGEDEGNCNSTYLRVRMVLLGVFVSLLAGTYFYQKMFVPTAFESPAQETVVLIYMVIVTLSQFITIPTSTWAGKMQQAKQDLPSVLQTVLYQIFRLILAILGYKAVALATSNLVAVLITLPIYAWLAKDMVWGKFDKILFRKYIKAATPVIIIVLANTLIYSTDKVILQHFSGSVEVGLYSAAFALSQFIRVIETSAGMLFFPYLTRFLAEKNFEQINRVLYKFERFSFVFLLPAVMIAVVASDVLMHAAYGSKFDGSAQIFSVITVGFFVSMQMLPYGNLVLGNGDNRGVNIGWVSACLVFLLLMYIVVNPSYLNLKGTGSALSILGTNLYLFTFYAFRIKSTLPEVKLFNSVPVLAYNIIAGVIYLLIYSNYGESTLSKALISAGYGVLVFGAGYLLKLITKSDFEIISAALNINKMKEYIRSEVLKKK